MKINEKWIKEHNLNLETLPKKLKICTITISCKLIPNNENKTDVFIVENIGRYLELNKSIISVNYANDEATSRTLIVDTRKRRRKKNKKKIFLNQVTLIVLMNGAKINVKLFKNGSIQITGCKNLYHIFNALILIFNKLKIVKAIYNNKKKIIEDKPFTNFNDFLDIRNITHFKMAMINTNFYLPFNINIYTFCDILNKQNIYATIGVKHKCVDTKYINNETKKVISIYIFESGSVIITGANQCDDIIDAYYYIKKKIYSNYNFIYS